MLDIEYIRDHPEEVRRAIETKGFRVDLDRLLALDTQRRKFLHTIEQLRHEQKQASQLIVKAQASERAQKIREMKQLDTRISEYESQLKPILSEYESLMFEIPNVPVTEVPLGHTSAQNVVIRTVGEPPKFSFEFLDHITLGKYLDIIDVDRGVKLTGNRGYILKNDAVRLEQALIAYALDFITQKGFTIFTPPYMAHERFFYGTGYFPWAKAETFQVSDGKRVQHLIGSAEVPLTAYHADEIFSQGELPKYYAAFTPCFRTEVGSYGKDTKGLYRLRQFHKVEQVILCENSEVVSVQMFQQLLANAEEFLQSLELPYRVMRLCTGEIGAGQVEKYDIETWMPSRNSYGETHSCSRFHDFQARRLSIRYKDADGALHFVHTLNNTLIASPRILIALLEVHQQSDHSIRIPQALQPYLHGKSSIGRS